MVSIEVRSELRSSVRGAYREAAPLPLFRTSIGKDTNSNEISKRKPERYNYGAANRGDGNSVGRTPLLDEAD